MKVLPTKVKNTFSSLLDVLRPYGTSYLHLRKIPALMSPFSFKVQETGSSGDGFLWEVGEFDLNWLHLLGNISNNMPFQPQPSSSFHIFEAFERPGERREESGELDGLFLFRVQEQFTLTVFGITTWSSSSRAEYKDASNAIESIIKMASSKVWTERRTFAECSGRALLALGKQEEKIQNQDKKPSNAKHVTHKTVFSRDIRDAVSKVFVWPL